MLTAIAFIIILSVLVFVHELGHFFVAKKNGVRVEEFGFGYPPRIFGVKRGETIYSLNWIPFGGFVKIFGEDGEAKHSSYSFGSKKIWRRATILLAGVAMNVLLGVALISVGYMLGLPTAIDDSQAVSGARVQIVGVNDNSPAQLAGVKSGDFVISISDGQEAVSLDKVITMQGLVNQNGGKEIILTLHRGQENLSVKVTPRLSPPAGEGALGVALARVIKTSYPWYRAIYEGIITTAGLIWAIVAALGYLIWQLISHGRAIGGEVAGPVGIYSITGQAAQMGFIYLLQLAALLSINLAIINALPFPALDGGRMLFLIIEKIKGSPVSATVEKAVHTAGFAFLIILMLLITIRDLTKIF